MNSLSDPELDKSWITAYPEVGRTGGDGATMILPGETAAAPLGCIHVESPVGSSKR